MSRTASRHPLDFERLAKGTWIEGEELEAAVGPVPEDANVWNLRLLALCKEIEERAEILCRVDHGRLRLMEDFEAVEYLRRQTRHAVSKLVRDARRTTLVDHSRLDDSQRHSAESQQRIAMAVAMAARSSYRKTRRELGEPEPTPLLRPLDDELGSGDPEPDPERS